MAFKLGLSQIINPKNRFSSEKRILKLHKDLENYRIFSSLLDELIIVVNKSYLNATVFVYNYNSSFSKGLVLVMEREVDFHGKRSKIKTELWDLLEYLPSVLENSYFLEHSYYAFNGTLTDLFLNDFGVPNYKNKKHLNLFLKSKEDFGYHSKRMFDKVKDEIVNLEKELDYLVK